ncbi:hypothetical protein ACSAZL_12545 [Methanosarcina sp. T3]|uniref:hypothetical protein n=1 Tax=Methanosarcina sp. T3 TaxID=3439062 RepID=UPI003F877E5C
MSGSSNALASSNGCEMENIIKALYPGAEFHYKGIVDFVIDGVKVENKSCQEYINASGNHNGVRSGRFCFDSLQHQTLVENNADYSFIVQRDSKPIFFARIPARKLKLGKWTGVKAVCWKTIIRGAV